MPSGRQTSDRQETPVDRLDAIERRLVEIVHCLEKVCESLTVLADSAARLVDHRERSPEASVTTLATAPPAPVPARVVEPSTPVQTPQPRQQDVPHFEAYLKGLGAGVVKCQDPISELLSNPGILWLAKNLPCIYPYVKPFLDRLYAAVAAESEVQYTPGQDQKSISACCQLCAQLRAYGWLKDYRYTRGTRTIVVRPSRLAQTLLTGEWLEYAVCEWVWRAAAMVSGGACCCFRRVVMRLPDGQEREADVLCLVDEALFIFECKSGRRSGGDDIARFVGLARQLGIPASRTILIAADGGTAGSAGAEYRRLSLPWTKEDEPFCRLIADGRAQ